MRTADASTKITCGNQYFPLELPLYVTPYQFFQSPTCTNTLLSSNAMPSHSSHLKLSTLLFRHRTPTLHIASRSDTPALAAPDQSHHRASPRTLHTASQPSTLHNHQPHTPLRGSDNQLLLPGLPPELNFLSCDFACEMLHTCVLLQRISTGAMYAQVRLWVVIGCLIVFEGYCTAEAISAEYRFGKEMPRYEHIPH